MKRKGRLCALIMALALACTGFSACNSQGGENSSSTEPIALHRAAVTQPRPILLMRNCRFTIYQPGIHRRFLAVPTKNC